MPGGGWGWPGVAGGGWGRPEAARNAQQKYFPPKIFMFGLVSRRQHDESGLVTSVSFRQESSPRALFEKY